MPAAIASTQPTDIRPFHGPQDTILLMISMTVGARGEQSTLVRSLKDHIVRDVAPKDYLSEILAVRNFVAEKIKYSNDAVAVEQVQDPERMTQEIVQHGKAVADCDEIALMIGTLCRQLGRPSALAARTPSRTSFAACRSPRAANGSSAIRSRAPTKLPC